MLLSEENLSHQARYEYVDTFFTFLPPILPPRLLFRLHPRDVPPLHLAVLYASTIHNTFLEAMTRECWSQAMPTNALLISGPSKTADIEQTLVYGVHGPKQLVLFLIDDLRSKT